MEYETLDGIRNVFTLLGVLTCAWGVGIYSMKTFARRLDFLRHLAFVGVFLIFIALAGGVFLGFLISYIIFEPDYYGDSIAFYLVGCVAAYPFTVLPYRYLPWHS